MLCSFCSNWHVKLQNNCRLQQEIVNKITLRARLLFLHGAGRPAARPPGGSGRRCWQGNNKPKLGCYILKTAKNQKLIIFADAVKKRGSFPKNASKKRSMSRKQDAIFGQQQKKQGIFRKIANFDCQRIGIIITFAVERDYGPHREGATAPRDRTTAWQTPLRPRVSG